MGLRVIHRVREFGPCSINQTITCDGMLCKRLTRHDQERDSGRIKLLKYSPSQPQVSATSAGTKLVTVTAIEPLGEKANGPATHFRTVPHGTAR